MDAFALVQPWDKAQHAEVGYCLGAEVQALGAVGEPVARTRLGQYVLIVLAASAKEVADSRQPQYHDADPFDAMATIIGGCAGIEGWPVYPIVGRDGIGVGILCAW